jgi:hypothetical protein
LGLYYEWGGVQKWLRQQDICCSQDLENLVVRLISARTSLKIMWKGVVERYPYAFLLPTSLHSRKNVGKLSSPLPLVHVFFRYYSYMTLVCWQDTSPLRCRSANCCIRRRCSFNIYSVESFCSIFSKTYALQYILCMLPGITRNLPELFCSR